MNADNNSSIITETYEKQINTSATYNYYHYSPQQYSPSTTESSSSYSVSTTRKGSLQQQHLQKQQSLNSFQKVYPLTLENVSRVQTADPSNMPLARYCSEMEERAATPESSNRRPSSTTSTRKTLRRTLQEDTVLESPRLLPFPYHNDSYFLPTAEHDYPGGCSVVTDASSSRASLSIHTFGSRQNLSINYSTSGNSLYHPHQQRGGYQRQLLSSPTSKSSLYSAKRYNTIDDDDTMSNYSNKRRAASVTPSLLSTLHVSSEVPQKKMRRRSSNNKFASVFKQNLLRFKSNSPILECNNNNRTTTNPQVHLSSISSANSIAVSNTLVSTPTNDTAKVTNKQQQQDSRYTKKAAGRNKNNNGGGSSSWFDKLWKFFKPSSLVKSNNVDTTAATTTISTPAAVATGPVWYSQFRCNPPPPSGMTSLS